MLSRLGEYPCLFTSASVNNYSLFTSPLGDSCQLSRRGTGEDLGQYGNVPAKIEKTLANKRTPTAGKQIELRFVLITLSNLFSIFFVNLIVLLLLCVLSLFVACDVLRIISL